MTVKFPHDPPSGPRDGFHALHYLAAWILLLNVCTHSKDLLTLIRDMSPLDQYGFVILNLVVIQGTRHYAGLAYKFAKELVKHPERFGDD